MTDIFTPADLILLWADLEADDKPKCDGTEIECPKEAIWSVEKPECGCVNIFCDEHRKVAINEANTWIGWMFECTVCDAVINPQNAIWRKL